MNTMQELLKEYKETRKKLKKAYADLRATETVLDDVAESERNYLSEMISDVEYVIEWLETGRRPESKRGIERRAAYEREKPVDPLRMQAFVYRGTAGSPCNLTEWEKEQLEDALCCLSARERECYILTHGEGFSFEETARFLCISKSSVQTLVTRAQNKIANRVVSSLFLVG
ncbi:sigma factor-like helix-turn-helix DNA-binding protein [Brevibacillus laterosporus]|uniref:Sigma factor-like helix-turn-helix DNA-binding protein n=1 Tax=Brevibacillus laterosporus TaxID=1465 RepID=A0AAP3GDK1_BRELA|nr:sigma factor-like helix-turn-helix DNA-binding protein [Brevibacillus laterosporus]MCR8980909.1 RNA polymerase subunit sigma-24 [Brevibacillus laterosporus]MCZ0808064.1 sigma factor-like helix-turn-helix DNA-binding protein [Brevibacillus laterosporus]MCZ0826256.1 sigma factor-like helix-turn-helix DNA-binding protein [Brevibacillus laterosporus]MCZ0850139.1 sigma factor-like helix-turn-helix DNA-binding protein [Brevibacillus laterosporus]